MGLHFKKKKNTEEKTIQSTGTHAVDAAASAKGAQTAQALAADIQATYSKPNGYTGNRSLFDSASAKNSIKKQAFSAGSAVHDPLTGNALESTIEAAKIKYGENWQSHVAEVDHTVPLERVFKQNKNKPWLTNENIRDAANSPDNLEVISREVNNAKRSRTNQELVADDYLESHGIVASDEAKSRAVKQGTRAQKQLDRSLKVKAAKNIVKTGHEAGLEGAGNAAALGLSVSALLNVTALVKGEKTVAEALVDTAKDGGKAAAIGYVSSSTISVLTQTLTESSSDFLQALGESGVPAAVITSVIVIGESVYKCATGEISVEEMFYQVGDRASSFAVSQYTMAIGQALIPIPVVGAAIGALVGSVATSYLYNHLVNKVRTEIYEHNERMRIMEECREAIRQEQQYRLELKAYLEEYFRDFRNCLDGALNDIQQSFEKWDANGVIAGSNQITRKLGGTVYYDNMDEFVSFLTNDSTDIL